MCIFMYLYIFHVYICINELPEMLVMLVNVPKTKQQKWQQSVVLSK